MICNETSCAKPTLEKSQSCGDYDEDAQKSMRKKSIEITCLFEFERPLLRAEPRKHIMGQSD